MLFTNFVCTSFCSLMSINVQLLQYTYEESSEH
uniref:Uncharacterized protein n=1 Tax=Anguilla anguilla TaxID=7936 RepID=A0A0E9PYS9_ANGAN